MSSQETYSDGALADVGVAESSTVSSDTAEQRAPRWLVALVLALLAAVLVVGGLVGYHALSRGRAVTGGDLKERLLEEAVRAHPEDLASRRQLAFLYQQSGRERDALREYEAVLSKEPRDLSALYNKGLISLSTGKQAEGERTLLELLKLAPSHSLAAKALGEYYVESKQFGRVVEIVVPAADAHRELADLQYLAGLGYEKTGRAGEAEQRYQDALSLVPDMAGAREGLERLEQAK